MHYAVHPAPHGLEDIVRYCWTLKSDEPGDAPSLLAAESCPNLVIVRGGSFTEADGRTAPRIHLAGPLSKPVEMVSHGPYQLFGLYLWPWGNKALFALEPEACIDQFLDVETLIGGDLCAGIQHLVASSDPQLVGLRLIEHLAIQEMERDIDLEHIVRGLLEIKVLPEVFDMVKQSGLARRQFERRFRSTTGFSPALFLRILRFQRCFRMLENGTVGSLTELALEAGYFDQSHFIRDFKRFSGMNPRSYFVKAPEKIDNFVRLV
ncbi:MAG: helix-turn-helix domain-containing protein [Flavobacteriales bacterium]|jgi:AraC-like DNA-binding protein|nr:helix-turn-helix domain-containing protein [Flavobacteriales bacterium]